MKKLLNTTYAVTVAAIGLLGLLFLITLVPIPGNVKVKVVKSGSMEPFIHVGSIVVIKPEASYGVGDVVTFGADTATQIPTTHRIVGVSGQGADEVFTTKGDANDAPDPSITHQSDIEGREILTVPYLGYVLAFARTKFGFLLLVGLPALAVFFEEGRAILRELRRMRAKKRRAMRMRQDDERGDDDRSVPPTDGMRRPQSGKIIGTLVAVAFVAGVATIGNTYGSTLAYYSGKTVSPANLFEAGVFDAAPQATQPLVLGALTVTSSDVVISDSDATSSEDDASSTPSETPADTSDTVGTTTPPVPPADPGAGDVGTTTPDAPPSDPPSDIQVEATSSDVTVQ